MSNITLIHPLSILFKIRFGYRHLQPRDDLQSLKLVHPTTEASIAKTKTIVCAPNLIHEQNHKSVYLVKVQSVAWGAAINPPAYGEYSASLH